MYMYIRARERIISTYFYDNQKKHFANRSIDSLIFFEVAL